MQEANPLRKTMKINGLLYYSKRSLIAAKFILMSILPKKKSCFQMMTVTLLCQQSSNIPSLNVGNSAGFLLLLFYFLFSEGCFLITCSLRLEDLLHT